MQEISKALQWRYAAKALDTDKVIPSEKLQTLLDSIRFAPSSNNFQPWKVIVITDQDTKDDLAKVAYDQPKVSQANPLIVFAARTDLDTGDVQHLVERTAEVQGVDVESLDEFKKYLTRFVDNNTNEYLREWAIRQTYIQLGFLLTTAAVLEVDAGPMEGFINEKVDEILGLNELGYASTTMVALGYRSKDDEYAKREKVRFTEQDVFEWIK